MGRRREGQEQNEAKCAHIDVLDPLADLHVMVLSFSTPPGDLSFSLSLHASRRHP